MPTQSNEKDKSKDNKYSVGYGKPPAESRFKVGRSGNPRGRPKGKLNLATILTQVMGAKVVVNEGGRRKSKSKFEVSMTQLANKAAGGNLAATKMMLNLTPLLEPVGVVEASTPDLVADRELAMRFAAKLAGKSMAEPSGSDQNE